MTREVTDGFKRRPARLDEGPLDYEPVNELSVVFLFSYLARCRWGLRVETIRAGFPDCIAYQAGKRKDYEASIRRVCKLAAPLHLRDLEKDRIVGTAGFIRGNMQGRRRASPYWPEIHRMIVDRNPSLRRVLSQYGPERLD